MNADTSKCILDVDLDLRHASRVYAKAILSCPQIPSVCFANDCLNPTKHKPYFQAMDDYAFDDRLPSHLTPDQQVNIKIHTISICIAISFISPKLTVKSKPCVRQ